MQMIKSGSAIRLYLMMAQYGRRGQGWGGWRGWRGWVCAGAAVLLLLQEVSGMDGHNVCMEKQKYNVTKRVKYRAPMAVRTYVWCLAMPPRCSKWTTEMQDLTRLETEERTAEVAVCCPGYRLRGDSCAPICPPGRRGPSCSQECLPTRWGPNCANECSCAPAGACSSVSGECACAEGWQGEKCDIQIKTTTPSASIAAPATTAVSQSTTPHQSTTLVTDALTTKPEHGLMKPSTLEPDSISRPSSTVVVKIVTTPPYTKDIVTEHPSKYLTIEPHLKTQQPFHFLESTQKSTTSQSTSNENVSYEITEVPKETTTTKDIFKYILLSTIKGRSSQRNITYPEDITLKPWKTTKLTKIVPSHKTKEIWIKPLQKGEFPFEHKISSLDKKTTPKTILISLRNTTNNQIFKNMSITILPHSKTTETNLLTNKVNFKTTQFSESISTKSYDEISSQPLLLRHNPKAQSIQKEEYITSSNERVFAREKDSTTITMQKNQLNSMNVSSISLSLKTPEKERSTLNVRSLLKYEQNFSLISKHEVKKNILSDYKASSYAETSEKIIQNESLPSSTYDNQLFSNATIQMSNPKSAISQTLYHNSNMPVSRTNTSNATVTQAADGSTSSPKEEDETFDVLTEPEHITAEGGERAGGGNTDNLLSVLSVAGGLMLAVITVAVVIVMVERSRRPAHRHDAKVDGVMMKDMRPQEPPPPYVRSIFHTPLPEPPCGRLEHAHYQPISTLDRELKQFMRPVVVHAISPIMLDNFRGILECHYDHLPRRDEYAFCTNTLPHLHHRAAPSPRSASELIPQAQFPVSELTIERLKSACSSLVGGSGGAVAAAAESEPLYAEIPSASWRPRPDRRQRDSNGEAVTEL